MKEEGENMSKLLRSFLKAYNLEDKFRERELFARWEELVGPAIYAKTNKLRFERGYLMVYLSSSTIRQELSMRKRELMEQINLRMKERLVIEISFK